MITLQSVPLRRCNGENQGQLRVFTVIMPNISERIVEVEEVKTIPERQKFIWI